MLFSQAISEMVQVRPAQAVAKRPEQPRGESFGQALTAATAREPHESVRTADHPDRAAVERPDRPARPDRPERPDHPTRTEHSGRNHRHARHDRSERSEAARAVAEETTPEAGRPNGTARASSEGPRESTGVFSEPVASAEAAPEAASVFAAVATVQPQVEVQSVFAGLAASAEPEPAVTPAVTADPGLWTADVVSGQVTATAPQAAPGVAGSATALADVTPVSGEAGAAALSASAAFGPNNAGLAVAGGASTPQQQALEGAAKPAEGAAQIFAAQHLAAAQVKAVADPQAGAGTPAATAIDGLAPTPPAHAAPQLAQAADAAQASQPPSRADAPVPVQALAVEIGMRAMRGAKEFQIRLDPEDLGRIDVRLEISEKGEVQAKVMVERVETLQLLQRDARTLERAFDQAGLKTSPDGLQFSLRDPGQQGGQQGRGFADEARASGLDRQSGEAEPDVMPSISAIYRAPATGGLDIRI